MLDMAKVAALLAMFVLPGQVEAQEKSVSPEKKEDKTELAQQYLKRIREYVRVKTEGSRQFLNQIPVDEYQFSGGEVVTAAERGSFLVFSEKGGRRAFIDQNSDGKPDRMIVNEAGYKANKLQTEDDKRRIEDYQYLMQGIDNLEENIKVEAALRPKDITILDLDHENEKVTMFDYGDGSVGGSSEKDEYQQISDKVQDAYFVRLEELAKAIEAEQ